MTALLTAAAVALVAVVAPAPAQAAPGRCSTVSLPVARPTADDLRVTGRFCLPSSPTDAVQVLIPGVTYDSRYWDWPDDPDTYSYVRHAGGKHPVATLALDRIGTGTSTHPPSAAVTFDLGVEVVHQVVDALRTGRAGDRVFDRVLTVGHSYGTIVGWAEAARYHDVDGLIGSGWLHGFDPVNVARLLSSLYPATLDPAIGPSEVPDPAYLTTRPGTRSIFYYGPSTDPTVLATDDATKQTVTATEVATFGPSELLPETRAIDVPVFLAVGRQDAFFCGPTVAARCADNATLVADEEKWFAPAARLTAVVVPDTGHDMNLQTTAPEWYAAAARFSDEALSS